MRDGLVRRRRAVAGWAHALPARTDAWLRWRVNRRHYRILDPEQLRATRTSDTVFVFGSGYSINELTPEEAAFFERHDTFGFNFFWRENLLRVDYHLAREMAGNDLDRRQWLPELESYATGIEQSRHYRETILLLQSGFRATNPNQAIGRRLLPGRRVFFFRNDSERTDLALSLDEPIPHGYGTLEDCVNIAFLIGWRTIVLVGVDLYDRRYFWLGPEETNPGDLVRDATWRDTHHTAIDGGIVDRMAQWRRDLLERGVELYVYNPRSLLARVMPVYDGVERPLEQV